MTNTEKKNLVYKLFQDVAECDLNITTKMALNTILVDYLDLNGKATPKKPNNYEKHSSDSDAWGKCQNCNKNVCDYEDKHCPECGQALDWSEDENK